MSPARFRASGGHLVFDPVTVPSSAVLEGDCTAVMAGLPAASVDFVLTDPPYVCRYRDRSGRQVANDDNTDWIGPAFAEIYRLMKPDTVCISFYGWSEVDAFVTAWRSAGFRLVSHLVFRKDYASRSGHFRAMHEQAYVLAKGRPPLPLQPVSDVLGWVYTGNRYHPTQKPVEILEPLIRQFSPVDGLVLDPFCGSGSTLVAAQSAGRRYLGIELDGSHCATARSRLV